MLLEKNLVHFLFEFLYHPEKIVLQIVFVHFQIF